MAVAEGAGGGVAEAVIVGKGFSPASLSFKGKEFRGWGGGGRERGWNRGFGKGLQRRGRAWNSGFGKGLQWRGAVGRRW